MGRIKQTMASMAKRLFKAFLLESTTPREKEFKESKHLYWGQNPHQGFREMARRRRQIARGIIRRAVA